jgi:hypothetical protein
MPQDSLDMLELISGDNGSEDVSFSLKMANVPAVFAALSLCTCENTRRKIEYSWGRFDALF